MRVFRATLSPLAILAVLAVGSGCTGPWHQADTQSVTAPWARGERAQRYWREEFDLVKGGMPRHDYWKARPGRMISWSELHNRMTSHLEEHGMEASFESRSKLVVVCIDPIVVVRSVLPCSGAGTRFAGAAEAWFTPGDEIAEHPIGSNGIIPVPWGKLIIRPDGDGWIDVLAEKRPRGYGWPDDH